MAVACLNLLRLQLLSVIGQGADTSQVGLAANSTLLLSLKQQVVSLASNAGVLDTIQSAAQATLQVGEKLIFNSYTYCHLTFINEKKYYMIIGCLEYSFTYSS